MNPCSFRQCFNFNTKLKLPGNFLFVGSTGTGKTSLFFKSLEEAASNYTPTPSKVYFLYQKFQSTYLDIKKKLEAQGISAEFSQAAEFGEEELREISTSTDGQILVAIDDSTIQTSNSEKIAKLFTIARHFRVSIVLFWHTLFCGTSQSRLISQNTSYFFLLGSPRMSQSIGTFGSQINLRKALLAAYAEVCKKPYGYVLVDLNIQTPHFLRVRTNVFTQDKPHLVFVPSL